MNLTRLHFPETVQVMVRDALAAGHTPDEIRAVVERVIVQHANGAVPSIRGWRVTFDANVFTASRGSVIVRATTSDGLRLAVRRVGRHA